MTLTTAWSALNTRSVIRLIGNDTVKFLQGLTTNNVLDVRSEQTLYTAMLNSKGRQLFDLFVHKDPSNPSAVFIDCPAPCNKLCSLLQRFKLRSAVTIQDVSADWRVVASWSQVLQPESDTQGDSAGLNSLPLDPRLPQLGRRGLVPAEDPLLTERKSDSNAYAEHRYLHGVAEGTTEIPSGSAIALEYNIDWLNGVSFDKGCYIGQELMARVHFGGMVRKRVFPILLDVELPQKEVHDIEVFVEGTQKSIGTLRGACGHHGIAHLRVNSTQAAIESNAQVYAQIDGSKVNITPVVPSWWPQGAIVKGN